MELARVTIDTITLGHITTHHSEDVELWRQYFEVASPGRLNVFAPGEIGAVATRLGFKVDSETIKYSLEEFEGPVSHLGDEVVKRLRSDFLNGPSDVVARYIQKGEKDTPTVMKLRWEFLSIKPDL